MITILLSVIQLKSLLIPAIQYKKKDRQKRFLLYACPSSLSVTYTYCVYVLCIPTHTSGVSVWNCSSKIF